LYIHQYINWLNGRVSLNGREVYNITDTPIDAIPTAVYRQQDVQYPKFFKMDIASKLAFMASELLQLPIEGMDKTKVATIISTTAGCMDVDKKFEVSRQSIPSPALFVYTLPNIMLGEICIRQGFKGAQMCLVESELDVAMMNFHVTDLLSRGAAQACLCGYVNATDAALVAHLTWISSQQSDTILNEENLAKALGQQRS
jgi:hypothetical protein